MTGWRISRWWVAIGLSVVALLAQLYSGPFGHNQIAQIAIFAIFAMSLDLLAGYVGLVSFGHAGFLGVGAYAFTYFTVLIGWPPGVSVLAAALIGAVFAMLVGAFVVRTVGVVFIMVTLAVSMMFYSWVFRSPMFKGANGMGGIPRIDLSAIGLDVNDPRTFSALTMAICAAVWLGLEIIVGSPFGRMLVAIRQNPNRVRALGGRVFRYRLAAFVISGALAALSGTLVAQHAGFVSPDIAFWLVSGDVLIAVIIGGLGTLVGPMLGATLLFIFRDLLSAISSYWYFWLGLVYMFVAVFMPNGICGWLMRPRVEIRGHSNKLSANDSEAAKRTT